MEELLAVHAASGRTAQPQPGLFRNFSTLSGSGTLNTDDSTSEGSDCAGCAPSLRRIAMAKQVLSECCSVYTPSLSFPATKADKCRNNSGALGPLMAMIQNEADLDKLRASLETLAFLLLDKSNRKVVAELQGLDVLLSVFHRISDVNVLISALDALHSMVKADDADKDRLWAHPGKAGVLALLRPRLGAAHLCEVLCLLRKMAFRSGSGRGGAMGDLLEPQLLSAVAHIMTPSMPHPVLLKALKTLRQAADCAGHDHLAAWHAVVFRLVPLLRDSMLCEATLNVLLSLSEHMAFKNIFMAAGAIPPLLSLLVHPTKQVAVTAVCVISCLSDVGLSREQLSQEPALVALLRTLQSTAHNVDVAIGVLYTLNRLASAKPAVVATLHRRNAPALLLRMLQRWNDGDQDLILAALQLLETLGASPAAAAPTASGEPGSSSSEPAASHQARMTASTSSGHSGDLAEAHSESGTASGAITPHTCDTAARQPSSTPGPGLQGEEEEEEAGSCSQDQDQEERGLLFPLMAPAASPSMCASPASSLPTAAWPIEQVDGCSSTSVSCITSSAGSGGMWTHVTMSASGIPPAPDACCVASGSNRTASGGDTFAATAGCGGERYPGSGEALKASVQRGMISVASQASLLVAAAAASTATYAPSDVTVIIRNVA